MGQRQNIAEAGNAGPKVRSDCYVKLELTGKGGIRIELNSKVKSMYGTSIKQLCRDELKFFGIENARLSLEDTGALPFAISARVEAAVKQLSDIHKEFLPDLICENRYSSKKERFRFSRLYLPGNTPKMMLNAGVHKPDGIILDLEDSVAPEKKMEARFLVRNALRQVDFYGAERMVRINQLPDGLEDLKYIIPHNVHVLLVPKCEDAAMIKQIEKAISNLCKEHKVKQEVLLMPIIESALGVENAFEIASASESIVALAIGLEDLTANLGVIRTSEATETLYARTRLVNACKAAGIQAIDSVFSDVGDMEGLRQNVKISRSLGFEGMGCIHPRQISIIHECFAPSKEEIEKAQKIMDAFYTAREKGLGVVSIGSKMIDLPVVKRAEKTVNLAVKLGLITEIPRNPNS